MTLIIGKAEQLDIVAMVTKHFYNENMKIELYSNVDNI